MNTDFEKLNGRAFPMKLDKDGTLVLKLYTGEIERFSSNPQNLENLYNLADYNIKFGSNKINPENVKKIKIIYTLTTEKTIELLASILIILPLVLTFLSLISGNPDLYISREESVSICQHK